MLSPRSRALHEANRQSWNAATIAHNSHKGDQIRFFRNGGDTLFAEELELLREIRGQRILHLQCNCGQDSLSLAKRGAHVTGVDISDQAIDFARHLARRADIDAEYHRADLYEWLIDDAREASFDVVFSSYGFLQYLSNLDLWARLVTKALAPGGALVLVDIHPVLRMFDSAGRLSHPYSADGQPFTCSRGVPDYVGDAGTELSATEFQEGIVNFDNPHPHHTFRWGLGDLTEAVVASGLRLTELREYHHTNGHRYFQNGRTTDGRRVFPPEHLPNLPMMFGLRAHH